MPCGQNGRLDQLCTSRTCPMAPSASHSEMSCVDSLDGLFTGSDGGHFHLARHLRHAPRIADGVRHGLLTQHVLVPAHGRDRDGCVPMIGRGDVNRVQILFLLQQLAIIAISRAALVGAGADPLREP